METLLHLDERVLRFVTRHELAVTLVALAVGSGLVLGAVTAGAVFGAMAAARAGATAALALVGLAGVLILLANTLVPGAPRGQRGTRS